MDILNEATIMSLTEAEVEALQAFGPDTDLILRWHNALVATIDDSIDAEVDYVAGKAAVRAQLAILLPLRSTIRTICKLEESDILGSLIAVMDRAINQLNPSILAPGGPLDPTKFDAPKTVQ